MRACIALEARLAAGTTPTARVASATRSTAAGRAPIGKPRPQIVEREPDDAAPRHEAAAHLAEILAADADQTTGLAGILRAICDELGIDSDPATLPEEYLDLFADADESDDDAIEAPDPHATYPP
jgi:hypothetical protein